MLTYITLSLTMISNVIHFDSSDETLKQPGTA